MINDHKVIGNVKLIGDKICRWRIDINFRR